MVMLLLTAANAQDRNVSADDIATDASGDRIGEVNVAEKVQVDPVNSDDRIEKRLQEIMQATGWFESPKVSVDRGVAFIEGIADTKRHQAWAEATAMNTADVVAVVNRVEVAAQPFWNFAPALESLSQLGREAVGVLPLVLIALVIGVLAYYLAISAARLTRWVATNRVDSHLLRQVMGNVVGVVVFIIGVYIALRVSGLTRLAVTLLGGTGLVGLALGFAFRDIAENYLSSILLSLNRPFRVGDLIEVEGAKGYVRKVTTRGTVLNTLEGNQIQMPNSTVYKGKITNFTATPLSRHDFTIGIGFEHSIGEAQEMIMSVLTGHACVVSDPGPMVIVKSLDSAVVNLQVLYWIDQTKHSELKVSSSVIRKVKQRLAETGITMPNEAREVVFPLGVPVHLIQNTGSDPSMKPDVVKAPLLEPSITSGEGNLETEQTEVMRATSNDETIKDEVNLIA